MNPEELIRQINKPTELDLHALKSGMILVFDSFLSNLNATKTEILNSRENYNPSITELGISTAATAKSGADLSYNLQQELDSNQEVKVDPDEYLVYLDVALSQLFTSKRLTYNYSVATNDQVCRSLDLLLSNETPQNQQNFKSSVLSVFGLTLQ